VGFLPTAYALVVAGLDLAVAALCWGWPRGELWPLENRWAGLAMAIAALTSVAAAMVMAGIETELTLRVFMVGAIVSFVAGTAGVIPADAPRATRHRRWVAAIAVPSVLVVLWTFRAVPQPNAIAGAPQLVLTLPSVAVFAAVCGGFQLVEAFAISVHWPRNLARSSLTAGAVVFVAGFIDVAALLGWPVPMIGAVTAAAIASGYIASRMLAQFRVALEGAEGRVPNYALQRFLGAGGMAEVFVAEAVGLLGQRRRAAVKRVRRDLVDNQEFCEMFLDEARLAAELHHPNIVEVYAFGTGGPGSGVRPYIAMELVDGLPLSVLLRYAAALGRPLPIPAVAEIGVHLCSALHYAHTLRGSDGQLMQVVHRDVSPHNVLVSKTGVVKLIDFGIARAASRQVHTKTGHMRGKLAYAAPEQIGSGPVDARTDVFSLGVLLFEATTLHRPFVGDSELGLVAAILEGKRAGVEKLRPDAAPLAAAIERAMEPEPDRRWPSAEAFGDALRLGLGAPLPGPTALSELVALVEAERRVARSVPSLPPPPSNTNTSTALGVDVAAGTDPDGTPTVSDRAVSTLRGSR
jgi:serine/threonine protein kinase